MRKHLAAQCSPVRNQQTVSTHQLSSPYSAPHKFIQSRSDKISDSMTGKKKTIIRADIHEINPKGFHVSMESRI